MKRLDTFMIIILLIIFTGCTPKTIDNSEELQEKDKEIVRLEQRIQDLESNLNDISSNKIYRIIEVMRLMKAKDMNALSQYIHPTKGVRFTPYFYTDMEKDKVFTAQQVAGLMQNTEVIKWGAYDGSGEPINLKFSDYYDKFVYDKDFANPQVIGNNVAIGKGNTIDNIAEAYPNGYFIEFHFSQFDPQFEGLDWESLRLVFEEYNNTWYLVGVIHGQWTI